jgi:mono/diheme cytochrome c family protein
MMLRGIAIGIGVAVLIAAVGAYAFVSLGMMPASADVKPPAIERWAAKRSLNATIARDAGDKPNPLSTNDENLLAGIKLYSVNCAVCHGAADGKASAIANGLYVHAPQLAKHGVEDDPASETYWKLAHGIRFTGMPAFGNSLSEKQIWQIALFLAHMDQLSGAPKAAWERLPSASAGT